MSLIRENTKSIKIDRCFKSPHRSNSERCCSFQNSSLVFTDDDQDNIVAMRPAVMIKYFSAYLLTFFLGRK